MEASVWEADTDGEPRGDQARRTYAEQGASKLRRQDFGFKVWGRGP